MANGGKTVAIVGGGIGGLACARTLRDFGFRVQVFDKGRNFGGRMAVRHDESGAVFDHGAQYFTVKDSAIQRYVEQWAAAGVVAPWRGRIGSLQHGQWTPTKTDTLRYVGLPDMTAIARHLANDLQVALQCRVASVVREERGWQLFADEGVELGRFDVLVLNAPAPQTAELLSEFPAFAQQVRSVEMHPCWAVMLALKQPLGVPWDAAFVADSPLAWIARNSSKPQRPASPDCWVLHAAPGWSTEHLEDSRAQVAEELLACFSQLLEVPPLQPALAIAHRWRFALPAEPLAERCLFDQELLLGACGDWCGGPRVEGALFNGLALAEAIRHSA